MRSLESQSLSACLTEGCQKEEGLHLLHVARRWDLFSGGADFGWPGLPHSRATLRQKELPEEREPLQPLELLRAPLCATHRKASRAPRISRLLHSAPGIRSGVIEDVGLRQVPVGKEICICLL